MGEKLIRIDINISDALNLDLQTDDTVGDFFLIDSLQAILPPHFSGKKFTAGEILSLSALQAQCP